MQAGITRIEKKYYPDSSGLRTNIYFSGCSMRCLWCDRQHSHLPTASISWDPSQCCYCYLCSENCPTGSIYFRDNDLYFREETCTHCLRCQEACPVRMLHFNDRIVNLDYAIAQIRQDLPLYRKAGGVKLYGLNDEAHTDFAEAILRFCKEHQVQTVIDTNGAQPELTFLRLIRSSGRLIMDLKHYDEKKHVKYTGVSLKPILSNLNMAVTSGLYTSVRISVVPKFNDTPYDAARFADLVLSHGVTDVRLHTYSSISHRRQEGLAKAAPVGSVPRTAESAGFQEAVLHSYAELLMRHGLRVKSEF